METPTKNYSRSEWSSLSIQERIRAMNQTLDNVEDSKSLNLNLSEDTSTNKNPFLQEESTSVPSPSPVLEPELPKRSSVVDVWRKRGNGASPRTDQQKFAHLETPTKKRQVVTAPWVSSAPVRHDKPQVLAKEEEKKDGDENEEEQTVSVKDLWERRVAGAPVSKKEPKRVATTRQPRQFQKSSPLKDKPKDFTIVPANNEPKDLTILPATSSAERHEQRSKVADIWVRRGLQLEDEPSEAAKAAAAQVQDLVTPKRSSVLDIWKKRASPRQEELGEEEEVVFTTVAEPAAFEEKPAVVKPKKTTPQWTKLAQPSDQSVDLSIVSSGSKSVSGESHSAKRGTVADRWARRMNEHLRKTEEASSNEQLPKSSKIVLESAEQKTVEQAYPTRGSVADRWAKRKGEQPEELHISEQLPISRESPSKSAEPRPVGQESPGRGSVADRWARRINKHNWNTADSKGCDNEETSSVPSLSAGTKQQTPESAEESSSVSEAKSEPAKRGLVSNSWAGRMNGVLPNAADSVARQNREKQVVRQRIGSDYCDRIKASSMSPSRYDTVETSKRDNEEQLSDKVTAPGNFDEKLRPTLPNTLEKETKKGLPIQHSEESAFLVPKRRCVADLWTKNGNEAQLVGDTEDDQNGTLVEAQGSYPDQTSLRSTFSSTDQEHEVKRSSSLPLSADGTQAPPEEKEPKFATQSSELAAVWDMRIAESTKSAAKSTPEKFETRVASEAQSQDAGKAWRHQTLESHNTEVRNRVPEVPGGSDSKKTTVSDLWASKVKTRTQNKSPAAQVVGTASEANTSLSGTNSEVKLAVASVPFPSSSRDFSIRWKRQQKIMTGLSETSKTRLQVKESDKSVSDNSGTSSELPEKSSLLNEHVGGSFEETSTPTRIVQSWAHASSKAKPSPKSPKPAKLPTPVKLPKKIRGPDQDIDKSSKAESPSLVLNSKSSAFDAWGGKEKPDKSERGARHSVKSSAGNSRKNDLVRMGQKHMAKGLLYRTGNSKSRSQNNGNPGRTSESSSTSKPKIADASLQTADVVSIDTAQIEVTPPRLGASPLESLNRRDAEEQSDEANDSFFASPGHVSVGSRYTNATASIKANDTEPTILTPSRDPVKKSKYRSLRVSIDDDEKMSEISQNTCDISLERSKGSPSERLIAKKKKLQAQRRKVRSNRKVERDSVEGPFGTGSVGSSRKAERDSVEALFGTGSVGSSRKAERDSVEAPFGTRSVGSSHNVERDGFEAPFGTGSVGSSRNVERDGFEASFGTGSVGSSRNVGRDGISMGSNRNVERDDIEAPFGTGSVESQNGIKQSSFSPQGKKVAGSFPKDDLLTIDELRASTARPSMSQENPSIATFQYNAFRAQHPNSSPNYRRGPKLPKSPYSQSEPGASEAAFSFSEANSEIVSAHSGLSTKSSSSLTNRAEKALQKRRKQSHENAQATPHSNPSEPSENETLNVPRRPLSEAKANEKTKRSSSDPEEKQRQSSSARKRREENLNKPQRSSRADEDRFGQPTSQHKDRPTLSSRYNTSSRFMDADTVRSSAGLSTTVDGTEGTDIRRSFSTDSGESSEFPSLLTATSESESQLPTKRGKRLQRKIRAPFLPKNVVSDEFFAESHANVDEFTSACASMSLRQIATDCAGEVSSLGTIDINKIASNVNEKMSGIRNYARGNQKATEASDEQKVKTKDEKKKTKKKGTKSEGLPFDEEDTAIEVEYMPDSLDEDEDEDDDPAADIGICAQIDEAIQCSGEVVDDSTGIDKPCLVLSPAGESSCEYPKDQRTVPAQAIL